MALLTKLLGVVRHATPRLLEATFGPSACFLTGRALWGLNGALGLALGWTGACLVLRAMRGQRVNSLLVIGAITLILRVAVSFALHSESAFLLAPALVTAALGAIYMASAVSKTPLLARFVGDLLPASWADPGDARLRRLCRVGSLVWGVEQIISASVSLVMISNLSVATYLMVHAFVSWLTFAVVIGFVLPFFWKDLRAMRHPTTAALVASTALAG